jgi:cathepsin B
VVRFDSRALPAAFDARDAWPQCSSTSSVRSQGKCGSCWAFASAEALSDRLCVQSRLNLSLSVEYLMDCNVPQNNGCDGGLLGDSWSPCEGLPTLDYHPHCP